MIYCKSNLIKIEIEKKKLDYFTAKSILISQLSAENEILDRLLCRKSTRLSFDIDQNLSGTDLILLCDKLKTIRFSILISDE